MLVMVEKGIRESICQSFYQYAKWKLWWKQRIVIPSILGCKWFIWLGNATKVACREL